MPDGVTVDHLTVTPSTMDAARAYVGPTPHWIVADRQTAARGRQGRSWLSQDGSFAATAILTPNVPPDQAALWSFVAACALHHALAQFVAPALLSQKWPNDVLLDGGKVAGILLEAVSTRPGTVDRLHIGIGVNLGHAPQHVKDAAFAPKGIADVVGQPVTPDAFLPPLTTSFARYSEQMTSLGFAPIRTAWMKDAARLGHTIKARTTRTTYQGRFDGIDDTGN
ncbi:MAG: biotin--[acetyl-CoA-carboxylase] ligase, partial [Pseudomonadota bacterium]